jgi:hypothetical protein
MYTIREWYEQYRSHEEEKEVAKQHVPTPQGEFNDFDQELPGRLRHCMCAKPSSVPFPSPPSLVCLIMFKFPSNAERNEELLHGALNGNDGDQAQHRVRCVPQFQKPLLNTGEYEW